MTNTTDTTQTMTPCSSCGRTTCAGALPKVTKANSAAEAFVSAARAAGYRIEAKQGDGATGSAIVTIETTFTPGDRDAYITNDSMAARLLSMVPVVSYGSTWGTDGASVGGHAGLTGGYYRLSKSGVSRRFVSAVSKAR